VKTTLEHPNFAGYGMEIMVPLMHSISDLNGFKGKTSPLTLAMAA
jgi:hypothetical protein